MDGDHWLRKPGAVAFRTFRRLLQFFGAEFKAAFPASRRRDHNLILGMFETENQVLYVGGNIPRRFANHPRDLRYGEGLIEQ